MFNDLLKEKDARLTEKDARLTDKDKMLNEKDLRLVALQAGLDSATDQRLCEVAHFKLVYELRDMFDWLLRSLYPTARTRPGAIFNMLIDELLDEGKVNLNAAAKERYNELALQFYVGQYEPSSLQDLRGFYKVLNVNMHSAGLVDVPDSVGLAGGGKTRQQQHSHAFFVATIQALCAERACELDEALREIRVLDIDCKHVDGVVANGRYRPLGSTTAEGPAVL